MNIKVMAIETSTYSGSIAVSDGEEILGEYYMNMGPSHSERLIPSIDRLLGELGIDRRELGGVAVSLGPGSFTALRIGITTAKGIAYSLGIPVVGVSSLELLAMNLPYSPYQICTAIDAKKGELFAALFRMDEGRPVRVCEDMVIHPAGLFEIIKEKTIFIGEGALLYRDFLEDNGLARERALFCPPYMNYPRASPLAYTGFSRLKEGQTDDVLALAPAYLRKPDAELSIKGRHHDGNGHN
ncbi:MAG: tRNA (adenosine(37)-N6)-threonylcarbamoyltransferase complex dimerization subunit type 1 TsaB [Thermodesulfobacteriota bacterium]